MAFLRVGRTELSAVIDDIVLKGPHCTFHILHSSRPQLSLSSSLFIDHNLLDSKLSSIPQSLLLTFLSSPCKHHRHQSKASFVSRQLACLSVFVLIASPSFCPPSWISGLYLASRVSPLIVR